MDSLTQKVTAQNGDHVTYSFVTFDSTKDIIPKPLSKGWDDIKVLFANHAKRNEHHKVKVLTAGTYKPHQTRAKDFADPIESITMLVLDFDGTATPDEITPAWRDRDLSFLLYSTYSNTSEKPSWRAILPLVKPVLAAEWKSTFEKLNRYLARGLSDTGYTSPKKISDFPACPPERYNERFTDHHDGDPLNPDDFPELPKLTPLAAPQPTNNGNGHHSSATIKMHTKGREGYAEKVLSGELGKLTAATNGTRNDVLNKVSFTLGRWTGGGIFNRSDIEKELENTAVKIGMKHTEDTILETIKSGLDSGIKKPKDIPPPKNGYEGAAIIASETKPNKQPENTDAIEQSLTITTGLPLDDIGNGKRLALMHQHHARHCYTWKAWAIYDDGRWVKDEESKIDKMAKDTARSIINEATSEENDDKRGRLLKHAEASFKRSNRKRMIKDAISEPGMSIKATDFDKDAYLFNVKNGTLDLRTSELRPHNPDDLITKMGNVIYDPNAQCPLFLDFLHKVFQGDYELIESMQRAFGYSLTGNTREQSFFIGHGGGSNGKSTLLQAIKNTMGNYAIEVEPATIMVQKHEKMPTDIADLHNIRLVITSESNDTQRLDEAKMKKMTGGEDLTGERKFEHHFKFKPQFKLFLATNHLPTIRGTDHSIWRRIVTVPFNTKFWKKGEGESGIPELKADLLFIEKLETESSGILNWLLEGCLKWQQSGLTFPAAVQEMKSEYRQEQDVLSDFLATHCTLGADFHATAKDIYIRYEQWCAIEGIKPISSTMMGKRLKEKGLVSHRKTVGNEWHGITLKDIPKDVPKELPM